MVSPHRFNHNLNKDIVSLLIQDIQNLSAESQDIHKKLLTYQQAIEMKNKTFKLISHNDINKFLTRHFYDSLIPIKLFPEIFSNFLINNKDIPFHAIDVGSGGGFPGLPMAIVYPRLNIILIEASSKKSFFLENFVIKPLILENVRVICARAENLALNIELREKYDFSFSRALAKPTVSLELVLPFIKVGGKAFFWGSGDEWSDTNRIQNTARILGSTIYCDRQYGLPGDDRVRKIVVLEKTEKIDEKYPRRVGVPQKRPL